MNRLDLFLALWLALPASPLGAQPAPEPSKAQVKLARSLYYDALDLIDRADWPAAADRLQRVLKIRDSAVVSYHLANAFYRLGRFVEADQLLRRVLNDPEATAEVRDGADKLLPKVEPNIGRLTLRLHGERESIRILIDDRETPLVALDVPLPVDQGEVSVVAMRDGEQVASASVMVGGDAGLSVEVVLELPARPPPPASKVADPSLLAPIVLPPPGPQGQQPFRPVAPRRDDNQSGLLGQWWFWTAVGAVAAAGVITTITLTAQPNPADASVVRGDFDPGLLEGKVQ